MMTAESMIMAIGFAAQMLICIVVALPLKIKKTRLCYVFPIIIILYFGIVYFSKTEKFWWMAYILESCSALFTILYCDEGNVWRNYVIAWVNFQATNVFFALECTILNLLHVKSSYILIYSDSSILGVISEVILILIDALLVAHLSRKIFKKNYEGDGEIFRILFFIILFVGTLYGYIRNHVIKDYTQSHTSGSVSDIYMYVFIVMSIVLIGNLLVYAYNRLEIARLEAMKVELQLMLANHSAQYKELTDNNQKLVAVKENIEQYKEDLEETHAGKTMEYIDELCGEDGMIGTLPLSGCISVDAVLSAHYKQFVECGIVFEYHIDNLEQMNMPDLDAAVLFDSLLKLAQYYCSRCDGERWVLVNTRHIGENLVIKAEFCKSREDQVQKPKRFSGIKRVRKSGNELRVVRRIAQIYKCMLDVSDKGEEASVSLLIQGCIEE